MDRLTPLGWTVLFAVFLFVYMLPTWMAYSKRHRSADAVMLVNLIFGWTVLGWLVALIWAGSGPFKSDEVAAQPYRDPAFSTSELPSQEIVRACPHCAETIKAAAKLCRYCNRDIKPLQL